MIRVPDFLHKNVNVFAHCFLIVVTDKILPSQAWIVLTVRFMIVAVSDDDFSLRVTERCFPAF